jgi:hypothetical protein
VLVGIRPYPAPPRWSVVFLPHFSEVDRIGGRSEATSETRKKGDDGRVVEIGANRQSCDPFLKLLFKLVLDVVPCGEGTNLAAASGTLGSVPSASPRSQSCSNVYLSTLLHVPSTGGAESTTLPPGFPDIQGRGEEPHKAHFAEGDSAVDRRLRLKPLV